MSVLNPGDRVRLITQPDGTMAPRAVYGVIDARQAGVYRVKLDSGAEILCHRSALAFQNRALVAKRASA